MRSFVSFAALVLGLVLAGPASATDEGYLYGRVVTTDGDEYEGQLRWGKEEAFWDDIFNANKVRNENLEHVDEGVLERMRHRRPWRDVGAFFGDQNEGFTHMFAARFGDLAGLRVRGKDDLVVAFRNGETMKLDGGSNDVGAEITVVDRERGKRVLAWNRIRSVEFGEAPAKLRRKLGEPLYGTVVSGKYEFTGHIQWDHDECLSVDELDGHTDEGKRSIAFGEIASIKKHRGGALVTTTAGREEYLRGTNDVNRENRGVVVKIAGIGSVKIGWADFDEVTFRRAPDSGRGYSEYGPGRELTGAVTTADDRFSGRIVFDLDEAWDFELLHGKNGSTEYLIPFRNIASITPRTLKRSDVKLRNGITIELEESQDVSRSNEGLLVFGDGRKPRYVAWKDVDQVVFRP
jgi:hypothetical protein